ncbi:hypothetical protein D3C81_1300640 [compost metagenome]
MSPFQHTVPRFIHFVQPSLVKRNQTVISDKQIHFYGIQRLFIDRMQHQKLKIFIIVHFRPLQHMQAILDRQRMEMKKTREYLGFLRRRSVQINPGPHELPVFDPLQRKVRQDLMVPRHPHDPDHNTPPPQKKPILGRLAFVVIPKIVARLNSRFDVESTSCPAS